MDHLHVPVVSVCCITFNHSEFIRACLDGFLSQETNFQFEIIINDDCSTDGTKEIILEYASKHPGIIVPVFHRENKYSQGIRGMFINYVFPKARGKYIAMCEGDDYWTDPLKLQKQFDFLENNPSYGMIAGGFIARDIQQGTDEIVIEKYSDTKNAIPLPGFDITFERMKHHWLTKTLTVFFKKELLNLEILNKYQYLRDVHISYHLLKAGKGYYLKEVLGVYHIHSGGIYSGIQEVAKRLDKYKLYDELYQKSPDDYTRFRLLKSILKLLSNDTYKKSNDPTLSKSFLLQRAFKLSNGKDEVFNIIRFAYPLFHRVFLKPFVN